MKGKLRRGKKIKFNGRKTLEARLRLHMDNRLSLQKDNRRKLLAKMDPETAAFTAREFAKLGLYQ